MIQNGGGDAYLLEVSPVSSVSTEYFSQLQYNKLYNGYMKLNSIKLSVKYSWTSQGFPTNASGRHVKKLNILI